MGFFGIQILQNTISAGAPGAYDATSHPVVG